jgi:hypothetical protein
MRLPAKLVELGEALELIMVDGTVWEFPKGFLLCSTISGRELWVLYPTGARPTKKTSQAGENLRGTFTGWAADKNRSLKLSNPRGVGLGKVKALAYRSDKWDGKSRGYIHNFRKYPTATANSNTAPRILRISGGNIHVRDVGITG